MRSFLYLSLCLSTFLFTSCLGMYIRDNNYTASTQPVEINGAKVKIALKPNGGQSYGSASAMLVGFGAGKTDGPFIWRVEGEGLDGIHDSLWVNNIHVRTSTTNRSEPFDQKLLNYRSEFKPLKGKDNAGKTFANHQIPGELLVYPKKDGDITITASVSVRNTSQKTQTKTISFELAPKSSNTFENIFIPTEIINSFGGEGPTEWLY